MILITGATGNNGAEVVTRLTAMGVSVRAMVRRKPESGKEGAGVEYAVADFDDPRSVRSALTGVDRAFLVTNSTERVEAQQLSFVDQAKAAGVSHIVYLSQLHSSASSPVRFLRYHAVVEDAIAASGMAFTHLRPNLYMQALLGLRQLIASKGILCAPAGDARVSLVDIRDIAAVAVAALTEQGHEGRTYDITGPEALTHGELAAELSAALEKPVNFVHISDAGMRDALLKMGVPEWQADGLIEDYAHYRRGEASAISPVVQDVTGNPPRSFRDFAQHYKQAFIA